MKKKFIDKFLDEGYMYLAGALITGVIVVFAVVKGNEFAKNYWHSSPVPTAHDTARKSMIAQQDSVSYKTLETHIVDEINKDASRGARSTTVYIGEFSDDTIEEVRRVLKFAGYETYLRTGLHDDVWDMLEVQW